jgi:TetR/AcrR family transcriptional regulator
MKNAEVRPFAPQAGLLTGPRSEAKRARILETAMRHFAERGYHATRIEDIATELSIAKGSVFQHFGSKEGLFLVAYQKATASFSAYLDAPDSVLARGFFETLRYWLERTDRLVRENWVPYRVSLLGNYGTDLRLRQEINRFLRERDPYGTAAFVRMGIQRGEVRSDIDDAMIVSLLDWTVERFQDALLTEEMDPGLFSRQGKNPERTAARIEQFLELLKSAVETPAPRKRGVSSRKPKGSEKEQ